MAQQGRPLRTQEIDKWKRQNPLRIWRLQQGMTHTEAAATIGIAKSTWTNYEWGLKLPKTPIVRIWSANMKTYVCKKWQDAFTNRTNVTYEAMVSWFNRKPGAEAWTDSGNS